nr:mitochondrial RNA pseudouridine synthase rpusd4-like isoform X2 [Oncorhynchus nerka]
MELLLKSKEYHGRLPVLAKVMAGMRAESHSQLEVRLGLDKETTETLLLARTDEAPDYVQNLHKKHQVERKYCIAAVACSLCGDDLTTLIEREFPWAQAHFKIGLSPVYRVSVGGEGVTNVQANRQAQGAVTQYASWSAAMAAALWSSSPSQG